LNYDLLLGRQRNSLVGHPAKCVLVFSQFPRVTTCQLDVCVQDLKDAVAYPIDEFHLTVRDYGLTQFRFGRPEYVKGVIIQFHFFHQLSVSGWSFLSGICWFEHAGNDRYPVTDLGVGTRGVCESRPGRACRD